ncbi:MAG: type IV secretory system conjugative DNA transfer family protein, partial [Lachnospiraceae bacterium]|nr:type IV secretory system conjugative DNA transfer family protein [Lachnospiraceae bacterium]
MVNKKELRHLIESYHIKFYIVFGIILFLLKDVAFLLMCQISHITSKEDFFYKPYRILTYSALAIIWGLIFFYNTRKRAYHSRTGRDFSYDSKNYHRSYGELVDYFKDADPLHMNIESLPRMNWRDSGGLIFGKKGDRLLSFEPRNDGICAMIWGSPGDGKTTSTIITSCRQFRGSVMVTDLKGDIYNANKNYRRIKRFSTIYCEDSAHYDPLAVARKMNPGERAVFLSNLAFTIIPEEDSQAKYFVDTARDYFTGIALYLLNADDTISFPDIIEQIVLGNFKDWVIKIKQSDDKYAQSYTNHFFQGNEKNLSGGYAKLVGCTRLFSSDIMKTLLTNDEYTISPDDLENGTDI